MSSRPLQALISIHDVMPRTLDNCLEIARPLEKRGIAPLIFLVSPGLEWSTSQLSELRCLEEKGHILAGHGWTHHVERIVGWRHRLHSRFISRDVAEHLALDADGIAEMIERNWEWFDRQGFAPPPLYVPPAWAMGRISQRRLDQLPFRWYENLAGLYDAGEKKMHRLPVVGFEADNRRRVAVLTVTNSLNMLSARILKKPLRIAIHPRDDA
ncbi:MAG: DUF2334 domain-containing protein, partial [Candidatus Sumerlaeota bacterium]